MKMVKIFIGALIVLIIQSTIVKLIEIFDVTPDLTLIYLISVGLSFGPVYGVMCGFALGFIQDVYSPEFMGSTALTKSLIGYFTGFFEEEIMRLDITFKVMVLVVAFFVHDLIKSIATSMDSESIFELLISSSIPVGIYTFLVGYLYFYLTHSNFKDNNVL